MGKKINLRVSLLRKRENKTQQELADALGVSYQTVSKWETGVTMPDIGLLPELASYFKVSVDELLGLVPLPGEEYDSGRTTAKEYWEKKREYLLRTRKTFWNEDYMKFLIDEVWQITSPVRILDCGCGYGALGLVMLPLLPKGSTYTGVDFAGSLICQGKKMFRAACLEGEFIEQDFYEYPPSKKYDMVICQAVLRHTGYTKRFLSRMLSHAETGGLVVCVEVNRETECGGLYVEGMDYLELCSHDSLKKLWRKELESEGRDYAAGIGAAYVMKELGLKEIDVRMNDKVSFVYPGDVDYAQKVEDFIEYNGWNEPWNEASSEKNIQYLMNHGMSRKEADQFQRKNVLLSNYFRLHKNDVSYTQFYGMMITYGRKSCV